MQKVLVIGCPGSGKSTFSRALNKITGIPLFYLDMLYWNADKTVVTGEVFRQRLEEVLKNDRWIIDGNYASTLELRLKECDRVFFLDYPLEVCLSGIEARKGKERPDMPWIELEGEEDEEFIEFIKNFEHDSRPQIVELLNQHTDIEITVFNCRGDADKYLEKIACKER